MASLMEELITVLGREKEIYEKLIPISERKTVVLIREDLQELQKVTDEEQQLLDAAYAADKKREKIIENIGIVLNRDPKELDLTTLARLMARQPAEKKQLSELHDSLKLVMDRLVNVNQKNKALIEFLFHDKTNEASFIINNYDLLATSIYETFINIINEL